MNEERATEGEKGKLGSMGLMNNLAQQCFTETERGREECPLVLMFLLFGLAVALDVLLTPAVSCGVVNLMHTERSKHQREKE